MGLGRAESADRARAETAGAGPHPVSRALEPAEFRVAEVAVMTVLLAVGLVLLILHERTRHGLVPPRALFAPWGAEDVLLGIAVFFLGIVLFRMLLGAVSSADVRVWILPMMVSLCGGLACLAVFFDLNRRYGLWPVDVGLRFDGWGRDLLLAAGMLVFVLGLRVPMSGLVHYLYERAGEPLERQFVIQQMLEVRSTWGLAAMVGVAVAVAPVWEEIAFRGFLQPFLRRRLGGTGAIVVTAVLFSLIHDPGSKFLAVPFIVFPLALALGYSYERTQRLAAPILLHVLHNFASVLTLLAQRASS